MTDYAHLPRSEIQAILLISDRFSAPGLPQDQEFDLGNSIAAIAALVGVLGWSLLMWTTRRQRKNVSLFLIGLGSMLFAFLLTESVHCGSFPGRTTVAVAGKVLRATACLIFALGLLRGEKIGQ